MKKTAFRMPRESIVIAALVGIGLLVRVVFFGNYTFEGSDCDGAAYLKLAGNISAGEGWTSHSVRMLFLAPEHLPYPEAHWSPLFPLLLAGAFRVFGNSFDVAKLIPLLLGVLLVPVAYWLARGLTGSKGPAFIAGLLAATHPTLATFSLRILTEGGSILLVALTFALGVSPRTRHKTYLLGLSLGLAYLMKYQNILLWPAIAALYFLTSSWRIALKDLAVAAVVFVVAISPWLVRNTVEFGNPFYTDLQYNVIAYYDDFGGQNRYFGSLALPPSTGEYFRSHPGTVIRHTYAGARELGRELVSRHLSLPFLLPLAAFGLSALWRRRRQWAALILFAALLLGAVSISIPIDRYVLPIVPFWIALAAAGGGVLWELGTGRRGIRRVARAAVIVLVAAAVASQLHATIARAEDADSLWCPSANYCALETGAAASFIRTHTTAQEAVLYVEPYHGSLMWDRNCIGVPFDERTLETMRNRYGIRYLVITSRDLAKRLPGWVDRPPSWAQLAYHVSTDRIPRPAGNRGYTHVSDLRVYRLGPPD